MGIKNPLLDFDFLERLDNHRNRITYVRITSLTLDSYPIERIEGVATGGSITIDGDSAVRRICNLTMSTKNLNINKVYWGITTQVKIEIGLDNNVIGWYNISNEKIDYRDRYGEIIWFPMGVYLLTDFKTSAQVNNYTITLSGKDKMCLLNGDIGGEFNAETDLGTEEVWNFETKQFDKVKRSIYYIIREMVHHYAQENYGNIIINNITQGLEILTNRTEKDIYIIENINDETVEEIIVEGIERPSNAKEYHYAMASQNNTLGEIVDFMTLKNNSSFVFKQSVDEDNATLINDGTQIWSRIFWTDTENQRTTYYYIRKISPGNDLGYRLRKLEYPEDLIAAAGETVTSILDKIIKTFPNYEYFYDAHGRFIFQEKQTYVNTAWNNLIREDRENYVNPSQVRDKIQYSFEGSRIVSAYQNTPKLGDIKNDYTVWGKKKTSSGVEIPIHMRYAIDEKPQIYISFLKSDFSSDSIDNTQKRKIFVTQEYFDKYIGNASYQIWNDSVLRKKTPPSYIMNATYYDIEYINQYNKTRTLDGIPVKEYTPEELNRLWWTVLDWGAYHQKLTGEVPGRALMAYQQTKYFAKIDFPTGTKILTNQLIFDVDNTAPYAPHTGPVYWHNRQSNRHSPFQHGFSGCGHNFYEFMDLDTNNAIDSWVFNPQLPEDELPIDMEENMDLFEQYDIQVVDWREIIYQMALDYYNYNHEDSYAVKLYQNNKNSRLAIDQFNNGHTGYEQYYHDIQGFWRNLYIPIYTKEEYLNSHRVITGISHYVPSNFSFEKNENGEWSYTYTEGNESEENFKASIQNFSMIIRNGEQGYYCEETEEFFSLNDLIAKDKILDEIQEQIVQKQNDINEIIDELKEDSNNESLQNILQEYRDELTLYKDQYKFGSLAIAPYNFNYYCEVNEEDFYNSIEFSTHNFPIYTKYTLEQEKIYGYWAQSVLDNPSSLIFWFDFFDSSSIGLGEFSVPAIGDRPKTVNNDSIRAIIYQDVPDFILIYKEDEKDLNYAEMADNYSIIVLDTPEEYDGEKEETEEEKMKRLGFLRYSLENGDIRISSRSITAQEEIDNLLYNYGYCNENITITCVPIYYLEPNTIISAEDEQRIVNGYYILNKMTIPLTYNGTMQNTATKVPERIY